MYLALYRKYRPVTFDQMVGQEHITTILKNQVKLGKIGHAYLFAGTRGTGKTSAAKILARAVNCLSPRDGNPCNECESCKNLLNPAGMDVIEIDAASNNRVDEVREIREKAQFTPVAAKYKVYIVDEVHMLTDSAFNALLKTLEEPPAHVIFILATTEAHKLPATILSRCMRFDFKLIGADKLEQLLKTVFDEQKKKYQPEAIALIAAAGEGSARDALSIAEMCLSFGDTLRYEDVLNILGATDFDTLSALAAAVLRGDTGQVFSKIDALMRAGKSAGVLCKDLLRHFRDLLIIKICADAKKLLAVPADIYKKMEAAAAGADKDTMLAAIEIFSGIEQELRYSVQPRIVLETAALKIMGARADAAPSKREASAEKPAPAKESAETAKPAPAKESAPSAPAKAAAASASKLWAVAVRELKTRDPVLYAVCANITGNEILENDYIIYANNSADGALLTGAENLAVIKELLGGFNIIVKTAKEEKEKTGGDGLKKLEELVGKDKLKIE